MVIIDRTDWVVVECVDLFNTLVHEALGPLRTVLHSVLCSQLYNPLYFKRIHATCVRERIHLSGHQMMPDLATHRLL